MIQKAPLEGAQAKLDRAREHFDTLGVEIRAFAEPQPYRLVIERDAEWHILRVEAEPVPIRMSLISGDVVTNARAALDHLAYQLVLSAGLRPNRQTVFPIYGKEADFDARVKFPQDERKSPLNRLDRNGPVFASFERQQPYRRGYPQRPDELWLLNRFARHDKHRTLHVFHAFPDDERAMVEAVAWNDGADLLEQRTRLPADQPLEHGTELARFRFASAPDPQVRVEGESALEITLGDDEFSITLIPGIEALLARVDEVIAELGAFTP